ncbi:SigE family RNA polymerase sigma factor [Phytomonospora endophytica]|uniref:RNA polymerase sigma-70 factor (Sigma-E family) n=1 Tax=Phytomonospora endophytica TaxID=714109 RepID=A0A841G2K2_9ACTN|nr:SigE family RNA polymerase sigma factor [Phytomonospora endophytica]MBB6038929.1 RNA polymerase sigma-70 factor (sigma-E family) [Phytomonospora endophytica]GIG67969.1 DNA-directed RNA polymerase sigma-70 factor [Phytomonospora endophytica]
MPAHAAEFTEFARVHTPALLRSAYLLTGDQHLAEDLVQVALSRTHRSWQRIDGNASAYTRRIMYHLQVSWWRKKRVREQFSDEPTRRAATEETDVALRLTVRDALLSLSPKQRAVVVLRFFEDRSVAEAAAILGCSPGTVKTQTSRALGHLRSALPELTELVEGGR